MEEKTHQTSNPTNANPAQEYYSLEEIKALFFKKIDEQAAKAQSKGLLFCRDHLEEYQPGTQCQVCVLLGSITE